MIEFKMGTRYQEEYREGMRKLRSREAFASK
jgi:hypothetical protein